MNKYTCERCGYSVNRKSNYINHLNRKNPCQITINNISIEELKNKIENSEEKINQCEYCKENFKNRQLKYYHKKICIEKNNNNINLKLLEKITELEQIIKEQKNIVPIQYNNTYNNNTYNNNTYNNNINLNNFGEETLSHITYEDLTKYSSSLNKGITEFIENTHFNKEIKENMNVRMKSKNIVEVVDDGKWIEKDCSNTIDTMISKGRKILFKHFIENKDKEERLNDLSEVLEQYFIGLINSSSDYHKLKRELFFVIKNNTIYLMQNTDKE